MSSARSLQSRSDHADTSEDAALPLIGAHVPSADPGGHAAARGAACAQIFLSSPQQWAPPRLRGDERELAALSGSLLPIVVHAPYLINLASPSPKVREQSAELLQATLDAAGAIAARGVVVHAGQAGANSSFEDGLERWLTAAASVSSDTPVLIENLAGGGAPMGRYLSEWVVLVNAARASCSFPVGVCLDTCHAWAAGEIGDAASAVAYASELVSRVGPVDLVHLNGSRDEAGSGRDRHANLADSLTPLETLAALVSRSETQLVVLETPNDPDGGPGAHRRDIELARQMLRAS